jgi:hypothetical protein
MLRLDCLEGFCLDRVAWKHWMDMHKELEEYLY